jgi:hypothetical protein
VSAQADELKPLLQHDHDGHKKPRLQMLSLLASGQAQPRQQRAHLLGGHRHTIGRWLAIYARGGLAALLQTYVPAGKPVSRAPQVLASLEQALHRPEGFPSYEALRQWVRQPHGVEVMYKTLSTLVRTRFTAKLKVARPTHRHCQLIEADTVIRQAGMLIRPFLPLRQPAPYP